jgi:hypothetical protein
MPTTSRPGRDQDHAGVTSARFRWRAVEVLWCGLGRWIRWFV